ncbi:K02A2.6-like [Cordylochernes scorpioides]|uniref:RNA-directed DNA polymerase n=1 Tax=Cordylochernes scorpioides TaxID=51811 RepID=A0ABY6LGH4_9ARAC|nr:K02A2.6-like [Cordylochernes scorpioides]
MAANLTPPLPMNINASNLFAEYKQWMESYAIFEIASGISKKSDEIKRATLLHCLGPNVQRIFFNLPDEKENYEQTKMALDKYFTPHKNVVTERFKFRQRVQKDDESIDNYLISLRELSKSCEFGNLEADMIRDQIIEKCNNKKLKEKLLQQENLTLSKTIDIARMLEISRKEIRLLEPQNDQTLNRVQNKPKKHYNANNFNKVKTIQEENKTEVGESSDEYTYYTGAENKEKVQIDGSEINMIIDTGSDRTFISYNKMLELYGHKIMPKLHDTTRTFFAYGQDRPLPCYGYFNAVISWKENSVSEEIYVIDKKVESLLGGKASFELGIIKRVNHVNESMSTNIETLVQEHEHLFHGLGTIKGYSHKVTLKDNYRPIAQRFRRIPYAMVEAVNQELDKMLENGIIEEVHQGSEWVSNIIVVPKRDSEEIRLCIDLREVNKAILRERHPIPTIDNMLHALKGAKVFAKLDAKKGFWQVDLDPQSRPLTAFITHRGCYRFCKVPFGLSSAPEAYQKGMDSILLDLKGVICYLDDVVVYAKDRQELEERLRKVLQRFDKVGIRLNRNKCKFAMEELDILGHIVSSEGIKPDNRKIEAVLNFPIPKNIEMLRSFLGTCGFLRKFIPNFSKLAEPLNNLIRKNVRWNWDLKTNKAFQDLKESLTKEPCLAYYNLNSPTELITDASPIGLGAVLIQTQQNGIKRPIAYASRSLTDTEKRYSQIEKETLGCVWAIEHFNTYIWGRKFVLKTDHKTLIYMLNPKNGAVLPPRIQRLSWRLQPHDFEIEFIQGKQNIADIFSRQPLSNTSDEKWLEDYVHKVLSITSEELQALSLKEIKVCTEQDPLFQKLKDMVQKGVWPYPLNEEFKCFYKFKDELSIFDNLILKGSRILLPSKLIKRVLRIAHETHQGMTRTKQLLREKYFWINMDFDIENLIRNCPICVRNQPLINDQPLQIVPLPSKPWMKLGIDIVGPIGHHYVLTVIDYYSSYPEAMIIEDIFSKTIIKKLMEIFARHGYPHEVVTDNGLQFVSTSMEGFLKECGIRHIKASPYYLKSNGKIERFHRFLKKQFNSSSEEGKDWKEDLSRILMSYRTTPNRSTGKTPAFLLFSREIKTKLSSLVNDAEEDESNIKEFNMVYKEKMKTYNDIIRKASPHNFEIGNLVYVANPNNGKLDSNFRSEHHVILENTSINYFKLVNTKNGKIIHRNAKHLKHVPTQETNQGISDLIPEESQENLSSDSTRIEHLNSSDVQIPDDNSSNQDKDTSLNRPSSSRTGSTFNPVVSDRLDAEALHQLPPEVWTSSLDQILKASLSLDDHSWVGVDVCSAMPDILHDMFWARWRILTFGAIRKDWEHYSVADRLSSKRNGRLCHEDQTPCAAAPNMEYRVILYPWIRSPYKNPNIKIPKYDGTEDPPLWIESLEEIGFLYHWVDYIIARYAAMNMTGSAKTWLNLHKASFTSCENIKIRLIQDFSMDANKEELRMKLNRMQHWNELAIRKTKIEHVIGGMKKEYSFALYLNPPKTTDELLVVCKKMDYFEKYRERVEKSRNLYNGPRNSRPQQQSRGKEQLKQVLEKYADLFSSGLGRSNLAKHRIDTEGAKPIKHKPYRVSAKEQEIIKEQIDEMLRDGIIRPSSSPWSFPVILVKKRDGKYRFCVDYRKLNDVTVKDVYPIPRIDEVLDTLQGSKYLSAIDLKSGYWQVEVEEKDKEKTAFTTAHGLYEFNVMPFGLFNAPATFEGNMENMLGNLRWQICLCYLDDVIIYSSDFSTHLKRIEAVLRCFREANLKLNNKKCQFAFEELEILGHITNQLGIKPAEHNIKAIRDFPLPKKIKEVQSFLGMCSYYRIFIKGFSKIVDPLTSLIKNNVPFTWTENQEKAYQTLKVALINPPILGHFDPNATTYIHTDASNIGLGASLVQKFGDEEKVISYLSRTLSKPEQNYSTTEKECLAVVWSMSKLRPYLYVRHFKIVTDHHALCWLKNLKDPTGRLARWAVKIQEYNFEIIHKRDDFIENIKENLSGNKRSITQNFKEENGWLYKKFPNPEGRAWFLVVPKKRRKEIMSENHNHMLNGHLGVARTTNRLKNKYYWPFMLKDVYEFVKRYAETRAASEATVKEVSKFLIEDIFLRHGAPQYLISDRGSQFISNLMKEVMKMCKIKYFFTTSYHPQTNGLTEWLNRTLINMLSMYVNTDKKNWDEILPFITHAYNTTIQETTVYSPLFLMYGREPTSLLDDRNISVDIDKDDYDEYIKHHLDKIDKTRKLVINNTIKTQERMKNNYDKKHMERSYEPGELLAVWTPIRKIGKCEKLLRKYFGPYRILKKMSSVNYLKEPKDNPGQDPLIVYVSRIKPYYERMDEVIHEDVPTFEEGEVKHFINKDQLHILKLNFDLTYTKASIRDLPHTDSPNWVWTSSLDQILKASLSLDDHSWVVVDVFSAMPDILHDMFWARWRILIFGAIRKDFVSIGGEKERRWRNKPDHSNETSKQSLPKIFTEETPPQRTSAYPLTDRQRREQADRANDSPEIPASHGNRATMYPNPVTSSPPSA